ncbi:MAG: 16S rRNA (cytosine(1402)-N(4))-methyltransferase RsmH [Pseudobutyrivibrio sp.]|nr:16S rRNA (cytosine(1402)-N(4))-methyltransferase RsmH [Pseudobutyrivibrio sp.]
MEDNKPHKRRIHYSGTHPKKFEEKYKEHNPEKYKDTIEKVIAKGSTPAGMHISIMVDEVLNYLDIKPGMSGCDCTLGYGGHTSHILEKFEGKGHLVSLDVDPEESKRTEERVRAKGYGPEIFSIEHTNFANIKEVAQKYGKFDFLMADLGVSSMQIDNPSRGFSYKIEAPLDLRMNQESGITAADRLRELSIDEIEGMLVENSDEPYASEIAKVIDRHNRKKEYIKTTTEMKEAVEEALSFLPKKELDEAVKKSCARVFQALRIDINGEYEALESLLMALPDVMNPGGRVVFLTFHSGEDRLVKRAFKEDQKMGLYSEVCKDVVRPGQEECFRNPRAKSTKLRWAIKA